MPDAADYLEQLDAHLTSPRLHWLLGAGVSKDANIPLMEPLTTAVLTQVKDKTPLCGALPDILRSLDNEKQKAHIEHLLSHLSDACTMARRVRTQTCRLHDTDYAANIIEETHHEIQSAIISIVAKGLPSDTQQKGDSEPASYIDIEGHLQFVRALSSRQQGVASRRTPIRFFTTNYDTLLEDALAIERIAYWDGFTGGAIGFRSHQFGKEPLTSSECRAHVLKLHGSIDWRTDEQGRVYRVRANDLYPKAANRVLIYPQATKYLATQRDPFAGYFQHFRQTLSDADNVLAVCGYGFGDEHINDEIRHALDYENNATTLIVFASEPNEFLESLRRSPNGNRVYLLTANGLYRGSEESSLTPPKGKTFDWWTFKGVTRLLERGVSASEVTHV